MDPHASRAMATAALNEEPSSSIAPELDEEAMWQMNLREKETLQYPERPGEPECAYYIRTGLCRFGMTCKFNHPANRRLGQLSTVSSPENRQQTPVNTQLYGTSRQNETTAGSQGSYPCYRSGSVPMSLYMMQRENVFPERPDQPECQFYMKTGDCKFGATCKFHHPRERLIPIPNCVLSPLGLPLRPGEPLCLFYSRYGICKFGPNCKFDHPVGTFTYSPTMSSAAADIPAMRRLMGSSSGLPTLTLSSEGPTEAGPGKSRRLSLSEPRQMTGADGNTEAEGSHVISIIGQVTYFS